MRLRVTPLYNKMWRHASSSLESRLLFTGVVEGRREHWERFAPYPGSSRRHEAFSLGFGYLPARPWLAPPSGVPTYVQPRGEP